MLEEEKWRAPIQVCRKPTIKSPPPQVAETCPRSFRQRWRGCEPGWPAKRSAPRTPPRPPGTGRAWSRGRRSAAPPRPCERHRRLHRGRPRPLWRAHEPERRWRRLDAESCCAERGRGQRLRAKKHRTQLFVFVSIVTCGTRCMLISDFEVVLVVR